MSLPTHLTSTLLGLALLIGIGAVVLVGARVPNWWSPALAVVRGALQLAVLSIVLTGVIRDPLWVAVALLVMFLVATTTSTRRVRWSLRRFAIIGIGMAAGAGTSLAVIFLTGTVDATPRYFLALGGILIGNSMSVATLTARQVTRGIDEHWDEVEGWIALGATPRQSTSRFATLAVREALVPSTDQTKTAGLVTLPGAFIGAIFGGLDPSEAGRFQIVVLAAIIASAAITSVIIAHSLAPMKQRPTSPR